MKRSTDRILTTHAGSLPRPDDLRELLTAKASGRPYDAAAFDRRTRAAVTEVRQLQQQLGVDVLGDGELGKPNFNTYLRERISGFEDREATAEQRARPGIFARDLPQFPDYFDHAGGFGGGNQRLPRQGPARQAFCTGPLRYVGQAEIQRDIDNFKAALAATPGAEGFLPSLAPGTIEHWLHNAYYPSDEAYLTAIADAMHEEYKAIADAGFVLQIDDPDLPDGWQMHPEMSVAEYRRFAELRVDALNHALRDIPEEQVRLHVCWGSYHGPHVGDVALRDIVDLVLKVKAQGYSVEGANPRHEHEWRVWRDVKLPEGKVLIPGVVGHHSDFIEHPDLVAERIVRFAEVVGKENVIAGTDCGLGGRVGHPSVVWAKLRTLAEGAALASEQLWG